MTVVPRAPYAALLVPLAALAGCGDDKPVSLPKGDKPAERSTLVYKGASSQRQSLRIEADDRLLAELKLLLHLSAAPEQVFSRPQLLEHVWDHSYHADARLVDACVARLRGKIENEAGSPRYVQTLRGFGYRFGPL